MNVVVGGAVQVSLCGEPRVHPRLSEKVEGEGGERDQAAPEVQWERWIDGGEPCDEM